MCPGRFPSPTPSRESTPIESIRTSSSFHNVFTTTPERPVPRDCTASDFFRQQPRFAGSQSEPNLPSTGDWIPSSACSSPIPIRRDKDRRRVSDPVLNRSRIQRDGNAMKRQSRPRRAISAQYLHPMHNSTQSPNSDARHTASLGLTHQLNAHLRPAIFTPASAFESPRVIDIKLHEKLRESLSSLDTKGIIYVIRDAQPSANTKRAIAEHPPKDPQDPAQLVKIGLSTRANYQKRIDEHERDCGFKPEILYVSSDIEYCGRAEKLIHIDLSEKARYWLCERHAEKIMGQWHEEYFQVSDAQAVETVKKWEAFMRREEPYYWSKSLNPMWRYCLKTRKIDFSVDEDMTHRSRRERWTAILSSLTRLDYLFFTIDSMMYTWRLVTGKIIRMWPYCAAFFWQTLALISWLILLLILRNTFAATAFAIVAICACLSMMAGLPKSGRPKSS